MEKNFAVVLSLLLPVFLFPVSDLRAQGIQTDRTEAPYFFIQSDDPAVDRLPLKSTKCAAAITGVIADISVAQVYQNTGERPIEAVYIFPASTRAAVYKLQMTIGERTIEARIEEHDRARQQYETAKEQGYSASLLEQQRPNVFQMNIANIMPGDVIRVELGYTEILIPEDREYAFIYPTVVGPRYTNRQSGTDPWVENPYLAEGEDPADAFDISVKVSAGMPIRQMSCPSHRTRIDYRSSNEAVVTLDPDEVGTGDRDFILRYRLSGGEIGNGLLLYEGPAEKYFLLMVQPPDRVKPDQIPAREYIFIVDVSGSMHGFPLEISKALIRDLVRNLRAGDHFNILLFAGGSSLLSHQSLPANEQNINRAIDLIDHQTGGGGTEILPALTQALALPKPAALVRTIVIATDGYVSVEKEAFDLIRDHLDKANLFAFGIGSSVNRYLIEGLARAGQGEPFVVSEYAEAEQMARRFRKYIETPLLTGISAAFHDFSVYDVEPRVLPDMFSERPVVLMGKWKGAAEGSIEIAGRLGGGRIFKHRTDVSRYAAEEGHQALRYLWARNRIATLSDYYRLGADQEIRREVTSLGLTYNLLTEFTSFLAVDSGRKNAAGDRVTVRQPLPLPQGVSNYAVGGAGAAAKGLVRMALSPRGTCQAAACESLDPGNTTNLKVGRIVASPGADTGAVRTFIRHRLPELQKHLNSGVSVAGSRKLLLLLVIEPDGTCSRAEIIHHTLTGLQSEKSICRIFEHQVLTGNWPEQGSRITCEIIL